MLKWLTQGQPWLSPQVIPATPPTWCACAMWHSWKCCSLALWPDWGLNPGYQVPFQLSYLALGNQPGLPLFCHFTCEQIAHPAGDDCKRHRGAHTNVFRHEPVDPLFGRAFDSINVLALSHLMLSEEEHCEFCFDRVQSTRCWVEHWTSYIRPTNSR